MTATGGEPLTGRDLVDVVQGPQPTHPVQRDVEDFHRAMGLPIGQTPAIRNPQLRASLIAEEARETLEAITGCRVTITFEDDPDLQPSFVAAVDGLCDLLAVDYGTAVEFGVDLGPCWDEVHRTNMAKAGGPKRADGKQLKPAGWTPPDLAPILAEQVAAASRQVAP